MCPLEELEVAAAVGQDLTEGAEVVSVTSATSDFQSCLECEDGVDEGAACADLAGATSREDSMPWAVAEQKMGAGCKVIAEAPAQKHMACSTSIEASGRVAGRRSAFHAGRAVVIEQMQES